MLLPHIASRLFNTPLMIDAGKAAAIVSALGGRLSGQGVAIDATALVDHVAFAAGRPSEQAGRLGDGLGRYLESSGAGERMLDRIGSAAIIPVEGTLVHKGKYLGAYSGSTSYEGLNARVARAMRDHTVKGVVFEVDSYGGEVAGALDTAELIFELSAMKPTIAILTDFAYSAGYLMASAARQIVVPQTGGAGSIGAIMLHADFSRQVEDQGVRVTVIASGARKAAGHPLLPLDDAERARLQASVDATREHLAEAIGRYRGPRLSKASALATEAQWYRGADAVEAGLADAVARPSEAFANFVTVINRAS